MSTENRVWACSFMPLSSPKLDVYTYTELYDEYWDNVCRGLNRNTKNIWAAEDIAQETFLRILKIWDKGIDPRTVHSLLSVISSTLFFKWLNKHSQDLNVDFRVDEDDPFEMHTGIFEETCDGILDPFNMIQEDQFLSERWERLEELTELDQTILFMVFINGTSMQEVAEELGMEYANVRKRLQRMRNKIGKFGRD
jgi:RNA polymerase sigma factor (sigma-70 family)